VDANALAARTKPARVVSVFTMSNSAVFFVPAARFCPPVPSFRFACVPPSLQLRRAAERRRRVTGLSVALARRDALPPERREGAPRRSTWRFSAARPALHLPAVPTGIRAAT